LPLIADETTADLGRAEPRLAEAITSITPKFEADHPGWTLKVRTVTRSRSDQKKAFDDGYSELDGTLKVGRHNYAKAQAVDVAIVDTRTGATLEQLIERKNISRKSGKELYTAFGELSEGAGLTWGGRWKTLYDPAHVQLSDDPPAWPSSAELMWRNIK
jgi:hypothetical protein